MDHLSHFVNEGEDRAHYLRVGSGPPVVLVHGGGAGADSVSNFGPALELLSREFDVTAVDMLGFGRSAAPDPTGFAYTQPARQKHLRAFLETLDLGPAHVVGNSMGGATALGTAMEAPGLFASITLMGTAGRSDHAAVTGNPRLAPLLNYDGTTAGMRALIRALTNGYEPSDSLVEYRVKRGADPRVAAAYRATMAWLREHGLTFDLDDIARVRVPTLVVHGRHDAVITQDRALEIVEAIEDASVAIFGHCGHLVMLEDAQLFCETAAAFWRDVERRTERSAHTKTATEGGRR